MENRYTGLNKDPTTNRNVLQIVRLAGLFCIQRWIMDKTKFRKTIYVAFFVSIAAQINLNILTEGFIVALSVMVMAIFIYCYEDLSAAYIACLSGVFSPLFRVVTTYLSEGSLPHTLEMALPDTVFFFTYAALYTGIYRTIIREPKSMKNFPYVIFFSDMLSNVAEMSVRSMLAGTNLLDAQMVSYLAIIALVRSALIMMVIIAIESYTRFLVDKERDDEYKRLLIQAATIEAEMRLMKKNAAEVETVTKKAYEHYYRIRGMEMPREVVDQALDIAKNNHEVKGDYNNVIEVLEETYKNGVVDEALSAGEIIALERANVMAMIRRDNQNIEIISKVRTDFLVPQAFKLMSILRNLLTNAAEAIGTQRGRILVSTRAEQRDGHTEGYWISVRDNGPGIEEEDLDNLFLEGYSTKFDLRTGNILRGLGLCLVKDFVENDFHGRIEIDTQVGKYTDFRIWIPEEMTREVGM